MLESERPSVGIDRVKLRIEHLKVYFPVERTLLDVLMRVPGKVVKAVDDATLSINESEVLGLVGETGCGKSTIAKTLLFMNPLTEGKIFFDGLPITNLSKDDISTRYFAKVQMVWQDPLSCLNPRMKVYDILSRPLVRFKGLARREIREKIHDLIKIVGINENELSHYPHEFSGGGRQRVVIARALISDPSFLIADEPTSSLDVSIQAQILNLLRKLKESYNLTMLFISHDLAVINFISNRVAVMYFGRIVELMPKENLLRRNYHWYTKALIEAIPRGKRRIIAGFTEERSYRLNYNGCIYYHRCANARERCLDTIPTMVEIEKNHFVACHFPNC